MVIILLRYYNLNEFLFKCEIYLFFNMILVPLESIDY